MPWKKPAATNTAVTRTLSTRQISQQLAKRAEVSFRQAQSAQKHLESARPILFGEPVRKILRAKDMTTHHIYEDKPFLTTRQQTADYMAARNNRIFVQQLQHFQALWDTLDAHLPQLQAYAKQTPQPEHPLQWLAQQIPTHTTLLFVGETHGYSEIRQATATLLQQLRQRNPQQQIILFTEFLPSRAPQETPDLNPAIRPYLNKYMPVWQTAYQNQIQVVGLEPDFVIEDNCRAAVINQYGHYRHINMWATLEGVRLRNEYWFGILQTYRAQYPDALFIVYSGAGHILYNYPFSLASQLPTETPYVIALYPDKQLRLESNSFFEAAREVEKASPGPLELLLDQVSFPQTVLQFEDKTFSRMAGFDVRLKIPVNLEVYQLEHGH